MLFRTFTRVGWHSEKLIKCGLKWHLWSVISGGTFKDNDNDYFEMSWFEVGASIKSRSKAIAVE